MSTYNSSSAAFAWPEGYSSAVSLSFDDGRLSQVHNGFPLFEQLGVRATFYLTPRSVEPRVDAWRDAVAFGHEAGNHTTSHTCSAHFSFVKDGNTLEDFTLERMEGDILNASDRLEDMLGVRPRSFAHPCGQKYVGRGEAIRSYVPLVAKHFLVGRGFRDEWHNNPVRGDLAQCMGVDFDRMSFEDVLPFIERSDKEGGWLIFAGHDIGGEGSQTTRADMLGELVAFCRRRGIWIDTVINIGRHIADSRSGSAC